MKSRSRITAAATMRVKTASLLSKSKIVILKIGWPVMPNFTPGGFVV